jgi:hypothetical protein
MNNFFRTLIAGYGAKKLGGGCFSTILVFIIIYWALGTCNKPAQQAPVRSTQIEAPVKPMPQLAKMEKTSLMVNKPY